MRVSADTPIGVLMTTLEKEIEERKTLVAMLRAVMATGVSPTTSFAASGGAVVPITSVTHRRRGGKKPSIAAASIEILRRAGRPMHGLREIMPALEAQGIRMRYKAGLATILIRTGEVERTAPGTFALKGGAATSAI